MFGVFLNLLYSLYFIFISFFLYFLFSIPIFITYPFLGRKKHYYYSVFARAWARTILFLCGLYPKITGRMSDAGKSYIYIFNHQSQLDILIALAVLPPGFLFIAKEELFNIPLLGSSMKKCGYIAINRKNTKKARETIEQINEMVRKGTSILIFPEGTRSRTGKLGTVKRGTIMIAFDTETPLLPVVLNPAYKVMPKGSLFLKRQPIRLVFGHPLVFDWTNRSREYSIKTAENIEKILSEMLAKIK
ncbi:MAG: lysophospholipid acyltransferase family protein [Candidatus Margulisbacteria bacterium]|nr:lysophospholipid acyltransferase family protein [Candidatus Margulisiibacteriota bacterium]